MDLKGAISKVTIVVASRWLHKNHKGNNCPVQTTTLTVLWLLQARSHEKKNGHLYSTGPAITHQLQPCLPSTTAQPHSSQSTQFKTCPAHCWAGTVGSTGRLRCRVLVPFQSQQQPNRAPSSTQPAGHVQASWVPALPQATSFLGAGAAAGYRLLGRRCCCSPQPSWAPLPSQHAAVLGASNVVARSILGRRPHHCPQPR